MLHEIWFPNYFFHKFMYLHRYICKQRSLVNLRFQFKAYFNLLIPQHQFTSQMFILMFPWFTKGAVTIQQLFLALKKIYKVDSDWLISTNENAASIFHFINGHSWRCKTWCWEKAFDCTQGRYFISYKK